MKKKLFVIVFAILCCSIVFSQTYEEYLVKAKQYESEKRWCYALGAYYDALVTDIDSELKKEALDGYLKLRNTILLGKPGYGNFNAFSLHNEWKNLLIDAEKFASSFNPYLIKIGNLSQTALNYENQTASYTAHLSCGYSEKYTYTIGIVEQGYRIAYLKEWSDLPVDWPFYSVSYNDDNKYNIDGALVFARDSYNRITGARDTLYMNAFYYDGSLHAVEDLYYKKGWYIDSTADLYDYKFNIVDENGNELVGGKRWLMGESDGITFTDIPPAIMDLIDNGKAFVNPVSCYLQYGKYNKNDDLGGRAFIKNFPEVELPINESEFICWKNQSNEKGIMFRNLLFWNIKYELKKVPDKNVEFGQTEVTQEMFSLVMGWNNSERKNLFFPVTKVSWIDAIEFCNYLSSIYGYDPVYSVNGEKNPSKWNYGYYYERNTWILDGELEIDLSVNGFRLPTLDEWLYAAKGGENNLYAGSDNVDEVAWYQDNSNDTLHPVMQKQSNKYELFDMSGNVEEWTTSISDSGSYYDVYYYCGGNYSDNGEECKIEKKGTAASWDTSKYRGFRLVRTITDSELNEENVQ